MTSGYEFDIVFYMKKVLSSSIQDHTIHPALGAMVEQLRAARQAKGLSQRALGKRSGLPQSHISQIENAGADIRVTSLLTLAHALDLELTLIPRQLLPLLESLRSESAGSSRLVSGDVLETLNELNDLESLTSRILSQLEPEELSEAEIVSVLHDTLRGLMRIHMSSSHAAGVKDRIRHLKRPLNALKTLLANKNDVKGAANYQATLSNITGTITPIARDLRDLRNRLVHDLRPNDVRQRPAYQLNNEEEDDG